MAKNTSAFSGKSTSTIFMVEDHAVFRQGLGWIIEQDKGLSVCGEATDAEEALEKIKSAKPDLALIDIGLVGMSGLELTKRVRSLLPKTRILILSMHKESLYAERALRAGANGYIMKSESGEELISAIHHVLSGQTYISKQLNETLIQRIAGAGRKVEVFSLDLLTDREVEVFQRVGQAMSTRQIADELGISMKTVEAHKEHIRTKLNMETNVELVQYAIHWVHSEKAPG
jgi:DNA-binding NarL/FixJ family response regulator